jgi:hypothetical protein
MGIVEKHTYVSESGTINFVENLSVLGKWVE